MKRLLLLLGVMFVLASIVSALTTQAAIVTELRVSCRNTLVRGVTDVSAPYVRVTVSTADNLAVTLGERVVRVRRTIGAPYRVSVNYPRQPDGTLLVVSVGEWDGEQYVRPATIMSNACGQRWSPTPPPTPTFVGTPAPTYPTPTFVPTPAPTQVQGGIAQTWTVTSTITEDTCGVGAGGTFPVTLMFDSSGVLQSLDWFGMVFPMTMVSVATYTGQTSVYDSVANASITYTLDLQVTSPTAFEATLSFGLSYIPGCVTSYSWQGVFG